MSDRGGCPRCAGAEKSCAGGAQAAGSAGGIGGEGGCAVCSCPERGGSHRYLPLLLMPRVDPRRGPRPPSTHFEESLLPQLAHEADEAAPQPESCPQPQQPFLHGVDETEMQNLRSPLSQRKRTDSKDVNNDVRSEMLASAIPPKDVQFEWRVFLPQLVLHLFPPLMILQLIPDMYLRADHLALAVGLALIISGMFGSVWCGALSFFAGSLLIIWWFLKFEVSVAAARSKCCCRVNFKFPTRGHTMSLIIGCICILIGMWAEFRFGDGFSSEHWTFRAFVQRALHNFGMGMVQIAIGVVIVFLVCFHWIALHYYIDRSSKRFVENAQLRTWTQPNARNIFGRMFSEQIKLSPTSEYRICGKHIKCADEDQSIRWNGLDGHNMMRGSSYRNTNTDLTQSSDCGWATELFIPIDSSNFTDSKWRHLNAYMKEINDPDNTYKHHVEPIRICSISNAKGDIKWEKYDVDPNIAPNYNKLDVPQPLLRFRVEYYEDEILEWRNTPRSGRAKNLTVRYLKLSLPPSEEQSLSWHSSLNCVQGGDHISSLISTRSLNDEAAQARVRLNQPSQGGPYVAGFRVQYSNISKANGDYLYQFDPKIKRLDDMTRSSHSGQTVRSYVYWQQETDGSSDDSKYRLFCDNSLTTEAAPANPAIWRIVEPYYKMRVSQSHTDAADHCLFMQDNEMAPQSDQILPDQSEIWPRAMMTDIGSPNIREKTTDNRYYWKVSGPPRKGWGSPAPPSVPHQPNEGLPQKASQLEEMTVSGFYRVKLELTIPRTVHIPLQKWLGSTIRGNQIGAANIEFIILQFEQFFAGCIKLGLLIYLWQTYLQNEAEATGTEQPWVLLPDDLLPKDTRLADSEVLLPICMYMFLAFVSAHEHACMSSHDSISAAREDRWWHSAVSLEKVLNHDRGDQACNLAIHSLIGKWRFWLGFIVGLFGGTVSFWWYTNEWLFKGSIGHSIVSIVCGALVAVLCGIILEPVYVLVVQRGCRVKSNGGFRMSTHRHKYVMWGPFKIVERLVVVSGRLVAGVQILCAVMQLLLLKFIIWSMSEVVFRIFGITSEVKTVPKFEQLIGSNDVQLRRQQNGRGGLLRRRDRVRKQELEHTFIESPLFGELDDSGPRGLKEHFADFDDHSTQIKKLYSNLSVYKMSAALEVATSPDSDDDTLRRLPSSLQQAGQIEGAMNPFFQSDELRKAHGDICMTCGYIVDCIITLSEARRLLHKRKNFWIVATVACLHASVPIWHAWLPDALGGGCGQQDECWLLFVGEGQSCALSVACSSTSKQAVFHIICVAFNGLLTFAILEKLLNCKSDYYSRYTHMLYFIQLTPWSNLRHKKLKRHWGLLPTFDLNTPGNVEAWNKLRLFLQSYNIKRSRYLQISALWCFIAVVIMSVTKIFSIIVVQLQKSSLGTDSTCEINSTPNTCLAHNGCEWSINDHTGSWALEEYSSGYCRTINCTGLALDGSSSLRFNQQTCLPETTGCIWTDFHGCQDLDQHFDTLSLFVVFDTLMFGIGLLNTLWSGMLSNEIKREAFPYVIKMKLSEILSPFCPFLPPDQRANCNATNFVSERSAWVQHRESWRFAESKLAAIVKEADKISDGHDADDEAKRNVMQDLSREALLGFLQGRSSAFDHARGHLIDKLRVHFTSADSIKFANTLLNEGCGPVEMGLLLDSLRQAESNSSLESAPEASAKISKLKDHLDRLHCAQVAEDIADFQERHSEIIHEPTISSRLTHLNPRRSRDTAEPTSSSDESPMAFHSAVHNERNRCISMLTNLAQVLEHEYSTGGLAHWGSEDRRTKMYFVSLDRSLIYNIITVLLGQVCAGLIGTWIKLFSMEPEQLNKDV